jgi:hypothetical protein
VERLLSNCNEDIQFLQTHLTGCAKEKHALLFRKLIIIIDNKSNTEKDKIIHFKDSMFNNKTALNWANENIDQFMACELVKREHDFHPNKTEGLLCLRTHLNSTALLPWITETYKNFFDEESPKNYLKAFLTVFFELVVFSYLFFFLDIYLDISNVFSYEQYASETFNLSELWMCGDIHLNSSCYAVSQWSDFLKETSTQTVSYEDMHHSFNLAFWITRALLAVTTLYYLGNISLDSNPNFFKNADQKGDPNSSHLDRTGWCLEIFLSLVGKLIWPFVHAVRRVLYEGSPKRSQRQEKVAKSDAIWSSIKFVENGLESSIQLFLQLFLLHPFLPTIAAWDPAELVSRCLSGFGNFFTFGFHPACYVEKILIRICLSVISLSLGTSQTQRKPGQGVLSTLPMFICIASQTVGRIYAFKSLVLMLTPLGNYKYVIFLSAHITLVLIIKILFETQSLMDTILSKENLVDIIKNQCWRITRFIVSGISSTIVMIHLRSSSSPKDEWHSFFLSHSIFHLLVGLENLSLVCFPYVLDGKYFPPPDCFTPDSQRIAVYCVIGMWLVGVVMHCVQYKFCHPWDEINGPQAWK